MTAFDWLEWDQITSFITVRVLEIGSLPNCVETLQIQRTKDLAITATAIVEDYFSLEEEARRESCDDWDTSTIGYFSDIPPSISPKVVLKNIHIHDYYTNTELSSNGNEKYTSTLEFYIGEIEIIYSDLKNDKYIIWLTGFSNNSFQLTRPTIRKYDNGFELMRGTRLVKKHHFSSQAHSRLDYSVLHISKDETEFDFILGYVSDEISDSSFKCGYIEFSHEDYMKMTEFYSEQSLIDALSYIFGIRLISTGKTLLDKHGDRIKVSTISLKGSLIGSRSWPPSINSNLLDERVISYQINQLLHFFSKNYIHHSLFLAWLGLNSPIEVSAIHLGAAIEALRDAISNSKSLSTKLFSDKIWKKNFLPKLKQAIQEGLEEIKEEGFLEDNFRILSNKIQGLNGKSSGMKYNEFFQSIIKLHIAKVENNALKERNSAAHGNSYLHSDHERLYTIQGSACEVMTGYEVIGNEAL
jgi:hypothetical protein